MVPLAIRVLFEIDVERFKNVTFSISETFSEPVKFVSSHENMIK
jgi:hypothetical protein